MSDKTLEERVAYAEEQIELIVQENLQLMKWVSSKMEALKKFVQEIDEDFKSQDKELQDLKNDFKTFKNSGGTGSMEYFKMLVSEDFEEFQNTLIEKVQKIVSSAKGK